MQASILICGGGILGLTLARQLLKEGCSRIVLIEKEACLGLHASGRNSGVLHAGIYYHPDSLKARFCLEGNLLLRQYCREKDLPFQPAGKVIVARKEEELPNLSALYQRAIQNGASVEWLDEKGLARVEPYAKTCQKAIYSPYTAVFDPQAILTQLERDLLASKKVEIRTNTRFLRPLTNHTCLTNRGTLAYDFFINSAGTYADQVAHSFGLGKDYRIIPFKGFYKKLRNPQLVRASIYPVPDILNPFLGVHFTKSLSGDVYLGPTAVPAFGRENYRFWEGLSGESLQILLQDGLLFLVNPQFRKVALSEPKKYWGPYFYQEARQLVPQLNPRDILPSSKVGIRPQLVHWKTKELMMDFLVETGENSLHVLNGVSPAFTSSMKMAEFLVGKYVKTSENHQEWKEPR